MSDDHSAGDARQPYADRGGPEGRHAETHDVRREALTNPTGPAPVDESLSAADDKRLRERLPDLDNAELSRLAVLETGTSLEQGGTYLDLDDLRRGPFKALGGQSAEQGSRVIAKRDTDYELWNRLTRTED